MRPMRLIGSTYHKRLDRVRSAFSYGVDYVLIDPDASTQKPRLFSRNRFNIAALFDRDHGGTRGAGTGADWVRQTLRDSGHTELADMRVRLLAQPRILGHVFNPVCFWFLVDDVEALRAVIVEVNNTFGQRHSYLCRRNDGAEIGPEDELAAAKVFHVSPFQPVEGDYRFAFDVTHEAVSIRINYRHSEGGLIATLSGTLKPLTSIGILAAMLRRPVGSLRVVTLIYAHAVILKTKGALYRDCPAPPDVEISQ